MNREFLSLPVPQWMGLLVPDTHIKTSHLMFFFFFFIPMHLWFAAVSGSFKFFPASQEKVCSSQSCLVMTCNLQAVLRNINAPYLLFFLFCRNSGGEFKNPPKCWENWRFPYGPITLGESAVRCWKFGALLCIRFRAFQTPRDVDSNHHPPPLPFIRGPLPPDITRKRNKKATHRQGIN